MENPVESSTSLFVPFKRWIRRAGAHLRFWVHALSRGQGIHLLAGVSALARHRHDATQYVTLDSVPAFWKQAMSVSSVGIPALTPLPFKQMSIPLWLPPLPSYFRYNNEPPFHVSPFYTDLWSAISHNIPASNGLCNKGLSLHVWCKTLWHLSCVF